MASVTEIGTLIDRDPKIRGGRPKIAGTGLTVSRIAGWYRMDMTPEEITLEYPHLTLAQVHAALAYYHVNRDEIEADLAQEEAAALQWEQQLATSDRGAASQAAAPALVPRLGGPTENGVEMILDSAGRSACATVSAAACKTVVL